MTEGKTRAWPKVLLWLASVVILIGMFFFGMFLPENNVSLLIQNLLTAAAVLVFLYLISGRKTFGFRNNQTGFTVRRLLPMLIFPLVFVAMGLISLASERPSLAEHWAVNLLLYTANMFLVGVYEEACFRACACDALLPALKKTRHPFLYTALISGLLFGYIHVVFTDFTDLQQVLQFFLKIGQLVLFGSACMLLYWKTRNLLGLAIIHGLNDFLPGFLSEIFAFHEAEEEGYTTGDASTTILFAVQLVITGLCFLAVYKKVGRTIDYKKALEEW